MKWFLSCEPALIEAVKAFAYPSGRSPDFGWELQI